MQDNMETAISLSTQLIICYSVFAFSLSGNIQGCYELVDIILSLFIFETKELCCGDEHFSAH